MFQHSESTRRSNWDSAHNSSLRDLHTSESHQKWESNKPQSFLFLSKNRYDPMALNSNLKRKLIEIQEKEITEHTVYRKLSDSTKGKNSEILKQISQDELRHYNEWREHTQRDVKPNRLSILVLARAFFSNNSNNCQHSIIVYIACPSLYSLSSKWWY